MFLSMLSKLMDYCEARREYDTGIEYGERILSFDIARERTYRSLMRLHYMARDRTTALRLYDRCVKALRSELDVAPATSTVTLYEQIRNDRFSQGQARDEQSHHKNSESRPISANPPAPGGMGAGSVREALSDLESCQSALNQLQRQLGANIATIQHHLRQSGREM
jgi:DNA-binding SARP family transcriptional activator